MVLTDMLAQAITYYDDNDPGWKQCCLDHKQYLISQSVPQLISASYIQTYVYDLKLYLRSIHYNPHCAWIIALINNFASDIEFTRSINQLLIPPIGVIDQLYATYFTAKSSTS